MSHLAKIVELVESVSLEDVHEFASLFMYQGFNPEHVMEHLHKIKEEKNISDSDFGRDIKTIIVMGLIMGNYNAHNSKKISDDGKTKADALINKYHLKAGSLEGDRRAVNVPRVMATFAVATSRLASRVTPKDYGGELGAHSLPNCMKVSVFASLVPRRLPADIKTALCTLYTAYTTEQTLAISKETNVLKAWNSQMRFTDISYKSSVPKDSDRERHLHSMAFNYEGFRKVHARIVEVIKISFVLPAEGDFKTAGIVFK